MATSKRTSVQSTSNTQSTSKGDPQSLIDSVFQATGHHPADIKAYFDQAADVLSWVTDLNHQLERALRDGYHDCAMRYAGRIKYLAADFCDLFDGISKEVGTNMERSNIGGDK